MKAHALSGKQSIELFDTVGKILAIELESATVKSKVKNWSPTMLRRNKIDANPAGLSDKPHWHVEVMLKK